MSKYPMLVGVDEARVDAVGGKAAILEEVVRRWPTHNVPPFVILGEGNGSLPFGERVYRTSSPLDVLGGCGLSETMSGANDYNRTWFAEHLKKLASDSRERIKYFARSIGHPELATSAMIIQAQKSPQFWAVAMRHPNNASLILVNYATGPSPESKTASLFSELGKGQPLIASPNRETYTALYDDSKGKLVYASDAVQNDIVELAAINYELLEDLGIVSPEWTSIAELGVDKSTSTFQFTPIRKKVHGEHAVLEDVLVFGTSSPERLPIVKIPTHNAVEEYIRSGVGLDSYPDFKDFVSRIRESQGNFVEILLDIIPGIFYGYMGKTEEKYPGGYIVSADMDKRQEFDIPMRNARAVIMKTGFNPLNALNHSVSRLFYKSPVLVLAEQVPSLETGRLVEFSCDGSSYSLKPVK